MVKLASKIKESHNKQKEVEKERETQATGSEHIPSNKSYGALLNLYDPNRADVTRDGEAIYIDLGKNGRMLDIAAMDNRYKDPEERHTWKTQPKGSEMKKLLEPLANLTSTNWDSTLQALCGKLSMHHRSMWASLFLIQASECKTPESLNAMCPHLLSLDTAINEVLTESCPKEAKSELEKILPILCEEMGASKAAKLASKITGLDKKYCYKNYLF